MSSLWSIEARSFANDPRSEKATSAVFWLRPGTYTVGRDEGAIDVFLPEDKSISRVHATITVPSIEEWQAQGDRPFIRIKDSSRYGTLVAENPTNIPVQGIAGGEFTAYHGSIVRFGMSSPFRLINQNISLCIHSSVSGLPDVVTAARTLGLPMITDMENVESVSLVTRDLVDADGQVVCALLLNRPLVAASWIMAWMEKKVWSGPSPASCNHPVALKHRRDDGSAAITACSDVAAALALAASRIRQLFRGVTVVWTPEAAALDAHLSSALKLAGATIIRLPNKGRRPKIPSDAVAVLAARPSTPSDPLPDAFVGRGRWTTTDLLIAAVLFQSLEGTFHQQQQEATEMQEPGRAKEGNGAMLSPSKRATRRSKRSPLAQGAASPGSTTANSPRGGTRSGKRMREEAAGNSDADKQRSVSSDTTIGCVNAGTALLNDDDNHDKEEEAQQRGAERKGKVQAVVEVPAPVASMQGLLLGRKRKGEGTRQRGSGGDVDANAATSGAHTANVTPARKRAKHAGTSREASPPPLAVDETPGSRSKAFVETPLAAGWKRKKTNRVAAQPDGAGAKSDSGGDIRVLQRDVKDVSALHAAENDDGAQRDVQDNAKSAAAPAPAAEDVSAVVFDQGILAVMDPPPPVAAAASPRSTGKKKRQAKVGKAIGATAVTQDSTLPNFKAFRKCAEAPPVAGAGVIAYDPQPYSEVTVNPQAFWMEEEARRRRQAQADTLFESTEAKAGRRRAAAHAAAGQKGRSTRARK